jgi:hypothetical protein
MNWLRMDHTHAEIRRLEIEHDARIRAGQTHDGCRLPFNGTLGEDERRMLEQFAFADWEAANGY